MGRVAESISYLNVLIRDSKGDVVHSIQKLLLLNEKTVYGNRRNKCR
jgi:hypothetical protein